MIKRLTKDEVDKLPKEVREDIYNTLKAYDNVNIIYEYGKYHVNAFVGIFLNYSPDYRFIGDVYAEDIYTTAERIKNYEEEFKCKCYVAPHSNIG